MPFIEDFEKQCVGQFTACPLYKEAFRLWCEYYYSVEEFDRKVCSRLMFNGFEHVAIPCTPDEYRKINESARNKRDQLTQEAKKKTIDSETFERARKDAGRYPHEAIKEMLGYMNDRRENYS